MPAPVPEPVLACAPELVEATLADGVTVVTVADIVANPDLLLDEGVVAALDLAGYDQLECYTELTGLTALPEL